MRPSIDLAIVGGGPAGAACALRAASRGLTVVVFDAGGGTIDKPCGEGLMPQGLAALRSIGLAALVERARPFTALRYVVGELEPLEIPLPRAGASIERPELMRALAEALRDAGVGTVHARASAERAGAEFSVTAGTIDIVARALVAADGLRGTCASWLRTREEARATRVGVRARFEAAGELDAVEVHFGPSTEVYLTPLGHGRINVAALADARTREPAESLLARALAENPRATSWLGRVVTPPELRVLWDSRPAAAARAGAFLAGDSGGGIDPIVGCGTSLALETGVIAADAVRRLLDGDLSGAPERDYAREYARRARAPRALAAALVAIARHPRAAQSAVALARRVPRLSTAIASLAARGDVDHRRTRAIRLASER